MNEFEKYATRHCGINSLKLHDFRSQYAAYVSPTIIEERQLNVATMDVFSRLMMDRIIFLGAPIYDDAANIIQAQLLFLESADPEKDIQIYINSPGGSVTAGLGIYDTMQLVQPDVATICTGLAASMGAVLLTAGAAGKRSALPHSRVMIHQPLGGAQGQASDIEITAREIRDQAGAVRDHCGPFGRSDREDRKGCRPRLLAVGPGGQGVRADRRGADQAGIIFLFQSAGDGRFRERKCIVSDQRRQSGALDRPSGINEEPGSIFPVCDVGTRPIDGRVEMMTGVCFRLYPGRGSSESSTGNENEIRRKTKDLWLKITEKTFTATRAMRVRSAGPNAATVRSC